MRNVTHIQAISLALMIMAATTTVAADRPAAVPAVPAQGSQLVFRDPVTGEIRAPTEAEQAELSRLIERQRQLELRSIKTGGSDGGPLRWRKVRLADGTEAMLAPVSEQQRSMLVVERDAAGEYQEHHAIDTAAAAKEAKP